MKYGLLYAVAVWLMCTEGSGVSGGIQKAAEGNMGPYSGVSKWEAPPEGFRGEIPREDVIPLRRE